MFANQKLDIKLKTEYTKHSEIAPIFKFEPLSSSNGCSVIDNLAKMAPKTSITVDSFTRRVHILLGSGAFSFVSIRSKRYFRINGGAGKSVLKNLPLPLGIG